MVTVSTLQEVFDEMKRAADKHGENFASLHEGISVIREEFEEVWTEVKAGHRKLAREEAIQLCGTVFKFLRLFEKDDEF